MNSNDFVSDSDFVRLPVTDGETRTVPPSDLPDYEPNESVSTIDYVARLAELRARRAPQAVKSKLDWSADVLLPDLGSSAIGQSAQRVNAACESINILEVYDVLIKKSRQETRGRTEGVMAQCPKPDHPDIHPSAWFGISKADGNWMLNCGGCEEGWDKYKLAALAYALDSKTDFFEIKKRMALQFRNVTYEAPAPLAPPPRASSVPPARTQPGDTEIGSPNAPPNLWEKAVEERKNKRLIELHGDQRAVQEWKSGQFTPPTFVGDLEAELAEPDPEIEWTIDGLHTVGSNTTITAGFKVGKTTFMLNLIKALVDQEQFLGKHDVRALDGRIAYWNFEVDQVQMKRNFRDMGIKKAANIWHLSLRGHPLNLMDDAAYEWAVDEMKRQDTEVLILDPWSGAYFGDENDNSQVNAFTKRLDELKVATGIADLFVPIHTGRSVEEGNERARGAAKIDDWTDNRWVLTKNADESRWLKAEGRRIELGNNELQYDRATNGLRYSGYVGTKAQRNQDRLRMNVLEYIRSNPGCSGNDIEKAIGQNASAVRQARQSLISQFDVETRPGKHRATLHYPYGEAPTSVLP